MAVELIVDICSLMSYERVPIPHSVDNGFWDTFRTVYPLLSLAYPDHLGDIVQGIHVVMSTCTCALHFLNQIQHNLR